MIRISVLFAIQRLCLLVIAFAVINYNFATEPGGSFWKLKPVSVLWSALETKISDVPELSELKSVLGTSMLQVFRVSHNPFIWIGKIVANMTGLSPMLVLILLSNVFFLLFLAELIALLSRMVTTDIATAAAVLMILWPTSYEMSLGADLSLRCFLVTASLRYTLDNQWLAGGISIALLALIEPLAIGLIPLFLYLFWYFQRHFQTYQVVRKALFFLIPLVLAILWRSDLYFHLGQYFRQSALLSLFATVAKGSSLNWTFARSFGGQTIALLFLAVGTAASVLSNVNFVHRLIPITMFLAVLLFSPYGMVASRVPLAGVCFEGVAGISRGMTKLMQLLLVVLSVAEIYTVFR